MVRRCSVKSCNVTYRPGGPSFFNLPPDKELREKWCQAIGKSNISTVKRVQICEYHFTKESIQYNFGLRKIKRGCLPTLFNRPCSQATVEFSLPVKTENEGVEISSPNEHATDDPPQRKGTSSAKSKRKHFSGDYTIEDMKCAFKAKNFFERVNKEKTENRNKYKKVLKQFTRLKKEASDKKALRGLWKDEELLCESTVRRFSYLLQKTSHTYVPRAQSNAWAATKAIIDAQLDSIKEAKTYKNERIITSKQASHIKVEGSSTSVINFCANNYLGLSSHPAVIEAGKQALDEYGAGLSSVRFICGTQTLHKQLEKKIAKFHGREDAILYPSCFDANAGLFEVLLTAEDAVLSDELNHASIIDGIRLCKAQKYRYKHRDMSDLESKLQESSSARMRLIVSDGVFSMDGNIAPLPDICNLAKKYNAMVFLDECHATGVFGKTGRGTEEHFNLNGKVDIINSTLGKALGGAAGGYTTGRAELVNLLRQKSRPYLFSNALPPPVVACATKALDLLFESSSLVERLHKNTLQFRSAIKASGLNVIGDNHPICPVMLSEEKLAVQMANKMLDHGIYVIGFTYPVVPKSRARVRVQISAGHSEEDIQKAVEAFHSVAIELGIL